MNAHHPSLTLPDQRWRSVIAAAGAAPSTHNTQPWRFVVEPDAIHLHLDPARTLPVADPAYREARISCGAALLNLRMALRVLDLEPLVTLLPQRRHATLLATVRLHTAKPATPQEIALHAAISRRHSHRHPFHPAPLPSSVLQNIVYAASVEGGYLRLAHDPPAVRALTSLIRRADHQQSLNVAHQAEPAAGGTHDSTRPDGVQVAAAGPRPSAGSVLAMRDFGQGSDKQAGLAEQTGLAEQGGLTERADPAEREDSNKRADSTGREGPTEQADPTGRGRLERDYEADPLLAVLLSTGDTPRDQIQAGPALQHALLTATHHGAPAPIFSPPPEVPPTRAALRDLMGGTMSPQLVLRFGSGVSTASSPRRPVDDLVDPS